jgi:hypothetical protein
MNHEFSSSLGIWAGSTEDGGAGQRTCIELAGGERTRVLQGSETQAGIGLA